MHSSSGSRGSTPIRFARFALLIASILAPAFARAAEPVAREVALPVSGAPSHLQGVRTIAQDQRGATFDVVPREARFDNLSVGNVLYTRITLPGAIVNEAPGKPAVPTLSFYLAVPDGMSPSMRVTAEEWTDRAGQPPVPVAHQRFLSSDDQRIVPSSEFTYEPDPAAYRSASAYPLETALLGSGAMVGERWVVPVHVRPIRWHPQEGVYRVLRRMTIQVDFVPATDREMVGRPAPRPGAQTGVWDRVERGLVQNYESARSFPIRSRASAPRTIWSQTSKSRFAVNPQWKLSVAETGWVSVSYATLVGTGFPSGIPIANVRLEERGYDDVGDSMTVTAIPVIARDNNGNGTFDAGDAVTFYARSLRDRLGTGNIELKYSHVNVYWLTWDNTPALTPSSISGDIAGAATVPASFRDVIRMEQNHVAYMYPNSEQAPKPEAVEHLFWTDGLEGDQFATSIPFLDPDTSQPFRIRALYYGRGRIFTHRLDLYFEGASGILDTLALNAEFSEQDLFLFDSGFTIPGSHIGGSNEYRHVGERWSFANPVPMDGSHAFLDVLEATYSRRYIARANYLAFTSGGSGGIIEVHVGGFTGATQPIIEVYDVTDPLIPTRVTAVGIVASGSGTWEAAFRTDALGGERRFVALVPGAEAALTGTAVTADAASELRSPTVFGSGSIARAILITPQPFRSEADRLANYRRGQGYVIEVTDIVDVFDEFNGGIKSPRALRRYLRHAYAAWTPRPTYVTLVGDGSLDYRGDLVGSSSPDWIPTYFKFSTIFEPAGYELVAQDSYYSLNLTQVEPLPADYVPSVLLTRIPVGSSQELRNVVDKVIGYEIFSPSDAWRGRQILYSDDEYSSGGAVFSGGYCFNPQEFKFKHGSQSMADIMAASPGGIGMGSVLFDLKTYTDAVPPSGGCKEQPIVVTKLAESGGGADQLVALISQGSLIFNLQTHANRYIISHEAILTNGTTRFFPTGAKNTPDRIQNFGRPWYAMVWGCHTNQFADWALTGRDIIGPVDSLDALGEQWLTMQNRGSIGSLGSTALEYLDFNVEYNNLVAQAFYQTPPSPSVRPGEPEQARWILGEVMLQAQVMAGSAGGLLANMNRTTGLFADPMVRMDALPPRVMDVTVAGTSFADNASLTTNSPTDSLEFMAEIRDEVGIDSVYITEQDLGTGAVTPLDMTRFAVSYTDSTRVARLTGNIRPRIGNYDLQIRAADINGRLRIFTMQVRTPIRYFANGVEIVNNVFVQSGSVLRAEVASPIPLTADSLELRIDGAPVAANATQMDAAGRQWALEFMAVDLFTGTHTLQVAIGERTTGFDQRTFQTTTQFTLRGVAVVDPRIKGTGCGGSVFQYELSADATRVELAIYSVAGRRVASITLPGQAGFNVYCWDGRDSRAHDAAQGVYLYRLIATGTDGRTVSREGRMLRVR